MIKDVFIHFIVFQDGFSASQSLGMCGHEAVYFSSSAFPYATRWGSSDSPTVALAGCFDKTEISPLYPNVLMDLYKESFNDLAYGKKMYSTAHGTIVKVFGFVHAVVGDLMARTPLGKNNYVGLLNFTCLC